MNEEQLKKLAQMTLLNTQVLASTLTLVCDSFDALYTHMGAAVGVPPPDFPHLKGLKALAADLSSGLGAAAKDLGVDWHS